MTNEAMKEMLESINLDLCEIPKPSFPDREWGEDLTCDNIGITITAIIVKLEDQIQELTFYE